MKQTLKTLILNLTVLAVILVFHFTVFAISISDYKVQLNDSIVEVDYSLAVLAELEQQTLDKSKLDDAIAALRKNLQKPTKIEDGANSIDVNTTRFNAELEQFEKEANLDKKAIILTGINEQLRAAILRIDALESAKASDRSKDDDKRKLNEILNREEFQKPPANEESLVQRWIREFFEWLNRQTSQPKEQAAERVGFPAFSIVLQVLIYGGVAALILFLIYRFAPFVFDRFGLNSEAKRGERVIFGEQIADDVSANDIFAEAEEFARRGEMRLAVRKGYIATLCELSDRKLIGLARHKTNRDYLRDVRKRKGLFNNLAGLTSRFERHWYGYQTFDVTDWDEFRELYRQALADTK